MECCKNDREYWMLGNGVQYRVILACKSVRHHLANMDDTFYSEILRFYTASEYKYPAYIYNTPTWTEAGTLPQKTADRLADFLYRTVCRFCCMDTLISTQGQEFVISVVDHLLERMSTEHRISSAYHSQTWATRNGQSYPERSASKVSQR